MSMFGETNEADDRLSQTDPFETAAARQRNAVKPEGGRQEGPITAGMEEYGRGMGNALLSQLGDIVKHPESIIGTGSLGGAGLIGMARPRGFWAQGGKGLEELTQLRAANKSVTDIANHFGVSRQQISKLVGPGNPQGFTGDTWRSTLANTPPDMPLARKNSLWANPEATYKAVDLFNSGLSPMDVAAELSKHYGVPVNHNQVIGRLGRVRNENTKVDLLGDRSTGRLLEKPGAGDLTIPKNAIDTQLSELEALRAQVAHLRENPPAPTHEGFTLGPDGTLSREVGTPGIPELSKTIAGNRGRARDPSLDTRDKVIFEANRSGKTYNELAAEHGISRNTIAGRMGRYMRANELTPQRKLGQQQPQPSVPQLDQLKAPKEDISDGDLAEFMKIFGGK